jgi:hypothetical protein
MQALGGVRKEIAVLVNRAPLHRHAIPDGGNRAERQCILVLSSATVPSLSRPISRASSSTCTNNASISLKKRPPKRRDGVVVAMIIGGNDPDAKTRQADFGGRHQRTGTSPETRPAGWAP